MNLDIEKQLISGKIPFVVIKECAAKLCKADIYQIRDQMYMPNKVYSRKLISFLNTYKLGTESLVDNDYPIQYPPEHIGHMDLDAVEFQAQNLQLNILGAIFVEYLKSFDMNILNIGRVEIIPTDQVFFETIYPYFIGFFDTPKTTNPEKLDFVEGVLKNNSGIHTIMTVQGKTKDLNILLHQVAYLKKVYRYAAKKYIPIKKDVVCDNLIHSSENLDELARHGQLFAKRLIQ